MTDGLHTGWNHATWAAGYALGALPAVLALAATAALLALAARELPHRARVARLHRRTRRDGRATDRIIAEARRAGRVA